MGRLLIGGTIHHRLGTLLFIGGTADVTKLQASSERTTLSLSSLSLFFIGGALFSSAHRSWRLLIDVATFSCLSLSCTSRNVSRPKFWRANAVVNVSPTPPLPASWLRWRGPQEGGSLSLLSHSFHGDVHSRKQSRFDQIRGDLSLWAHMECLVDCFLGPPRRWAVSFSLHPSP